MNEYEEFLDIVEQAVDLLKGQIGRLKNSLETNRRLEQEFEHHVLLALSGVSKNSKFEFKAMSSVHAFPDIIAINENGKCFGVEVKTSKSWTTNGNSINASISDSRISEVIVIFCKTSEPIEIAFKNYEEAISGVHVTHSPRYILNMTKSNRGLLSDMEISYKKFKSLAINEKVKILRNWYVKKGRDKGKWWIY